jgi:hypothetical protein
VEFIDVLFLFSRSIDLCDIKRIVRDAVADAGNITQHAAERTSTLCRELL